MVRRSGSSGGVRGWWRRHRDASKATLDLRDPSLTVTVTGYHPALSCGAALAAAGVGEGENGGPAVLRQLVLVPAGRRADVLAAAELDGYTAVDGDVPAGVWPEGAAPRPGGDAVALTLCRPAELSALVCAQERSRMVGLAQRHGGDAVGWDGLQPAPKAPGAGR